MPILTAEERVGTLLAGRYRLESILGSGGTSVVYRASHAWTARSVAVKLLKPEHARDRGLVMRFLREARTASTLVHPNVVTILDMGTDPEGDVYLAMEHLTGESLGALLDREGALEVPRAAELLRPIMEAIASAHARGIVHRDVKPDNVLIGDRGDGVTRSILLDFGMAKMTEAAWGHATQSGLIVGTPFYMSPEQAEGASDVGPASDVWSMGVLWYRCLSGTLPFFGSAPTSLLLAIVRGDHVPLGERVPGVPEAIASVVERALCVERSERYADMKEMLAALDRALAGEVDRGWSGNGARTASLASTPATPLRSQPELEPAPAKPSAKGRMVAAIAVAALLVVAAITGGAMMTSSEPAPELAESPAIVAPSAPAPRSSVGAASAPAPVTAEAAADPVVVPPAVATTPEPATAGPASDVEGERTAARAQPIPTTRPTVTAIPAMASPPAATEAPPASERPRRRGLARTIDDRDERPTSGLATEW